MKKTNTHMKNQTFVMFWLGVLTGALLIVAFYTMGATSDDLSGRLRRSTNLPSSSYTVPTSNFRYSAPVNNYRTQYEMPSMDYGTKYEMPSMDYRTQYEMPSMDYDALQNSVLKADKSYDVYSTPTKDYSTKYEMPTMDYRTQYEMPTMDYDAYKY